MSYLAIPPRLLTIERLGRIRALAQAGAVGVGSHTIFKSKSDLAHSLLVHVMATFGHGCLGPATGP